MFSLILERVFIFVTPAYVFAAIVLVLSLAHGNARRIPWRVVVALLSAPLLFIGLIVLTGGFAAVILSALFVIADASFAAAMAWRYRSIDPAVAFCALASAWAALVVLLSLIIH